MKRNLWLLALLFFLAYHASYGQRLPSTQIAEGSSSMSITFKFDGKDYKYQLTSKDIKNTPSWKPTDGEPPLSLSEAVRIATKKLRDYVRNADVFKPKKIDLAELGPEKWYYTINFDCYKCVAEQMLAHASGGFPILVKMDGSVVEPEKISKEKQKPN